ncbi:MAG: hypothetical protein GTN36_02835 [Candidatus Aenigmarchaeota archaeon]|nr:hypothetical protein [Candidatus Aenigmarchaeota archaeon]
MKFFWILVLITIIVAYFQLLFYKSLEIIVTFVIIDFMVLWAYIELENNKKDKQRNILLVKIENLERLTSELFEKVTSRFSNKENNKEKLIEWLNKF